MATRYEFYHHSASDQGYGSTPGQFWGSDWRAQVFTPTTNHTIKCVFLLLGRAGTPGTITVAIKATTAGVPSGADLCSGTVSGNGLPDYWTHPVPSWIAVDLGAGTALTASTPYAIVVKSLSGDIDNWICWVPYAENPYTGGKGYWSDDSGVTWAEFTWTTYHGDFPFEEWDEVPTWVVPLCGMDVRLARPLLSGDLFFTIPVCAMDCAGLQPCIPLNFTIPICAMDCVALQCLHSHSLNHSIIKPEYFDTPKLINRVYVVGVDADGNTVYGEAKDTTINGEFLQIYPDSMINSTAHANTIAANILAKARLNAERGQILIPPAIQNELWDVIKIDDTVCNQSDTTYRVSGWTFLYQTFIPNQQEAKYEMLVKLTAI